MSDLSLVKRFNTGWGEQIVINGSINIHIQPIHIYYVCMYIHKIMTSFGIFLSQESQSQCNVCLMENCIKTSLFLIMRFLTKSVTLLKTVNNMNTYSKHTSLNIYIFCRLSLNYCMDIWWIMCKNAQLLLKNNFFWCVNLDHQRLFVAVSVNVRSCMKVCKVWGERWEVEVVKCWYKVTWECDSGHSRWHQARQRRPDMNQTSADCGSMETQDR